MSQVRENYKQRQPAVESYFINSFILGLNLMVPCSQAYNEGV